MDKLLKKSKLNQSFDYVLNDEYNFDYYNEEDEILDLFYILHKERIKDNEV